MATGTLSLGQASGIGIGRRSHVPVLCREKSTRVGIGRDWRGNAVVCVDGRGNNSRGRLTSNDLIFPV